jgi:uncharacterized protein
MMQLRIPVTDIKDEGFPVDGAFSIEDVRPADAVPLSVSRAAIKGLLTLMGEEVLFRGRITGAFKQPCDRCLEEIELPFAVECTWFFEQDTGETEELDDEIYRIDGETVDLGRYVWEELALSLPLRFVCDDNLPCANRDRFRALADDEGAPEVASPFAKLKDLFPADGGDKNKE